MSVLCQVVNLNTKLPYRLQKAPGREAYWVVNTESGRKYSINPLPRDHAAAQMRALYAREGGYRLSPARAERYRRSRSRRLSGGKAPRSRAVRASRARKSRAMRR